ncbi:MAG: hypothetical protein CMJ02_01625 [Pelagibacteraceae bacterium]|nr:hypothetical protein [Pelagibacteraceae bacterium]OUV89225.1 MAG: hypothetical protein CBD06_01690 [Pelagibacteraceae bacterium TMED146]|tara:strand:- start:4673 stop:5056 length:384 start_codon:yes stop_codon:yes gene_type:complete
MATKIIIFIYLFFFSFSSFGNELVKVLNNGENYAEIKIIDKITSRLTTEKINLKTLKNIKDFEIFIDKCVLDTRKGFLEISALVQIKDIKNQTKDRVFLFNNWIFASNSSVNEIEHPNYDISLKSCN